MTDEHQSKWVTESTGFNFASKDYPELEEILTERLPLKRSVPSTNRFKMKASKTARQADIHRGLVITLNRQEDSFGVMERCATGTATAQDLLGLVNRNGLGVWWEEGSEDIAYDFAWGDESLIKWDRETRDEESYYRDRGGELGVLLHGTTEVSEDWDPGYDIGGNIDKGAVINLIDIKYSPGEDKWYTVSMGGRRVQAVNFDSDEQALEYALWAWGSNARLSAQEEQILTEAIRTQGKPIPTLYRGGTTKGSGRLLGLSSNKNTAKDFGSYNADGSGYRDLVEIPAGSARGIEVPYNNDRREDEWIVIASEVHPKAITGAYDPTNFQATATWHDVQAKAKQIRSEGGVRIISTQDPYIAAHVQGEHGVYESTLQRGPNGTVNQWTCTCPWFHYSFGRTGKWKKYEGRMCAHCLATQYEAQSEGMFGGKIHEDSYGRDWDTGITEYDPGKRVLRYDPNKPTVAKTIQPIAYQSLATSDEIAAIHLWTDIKVNLRGVSGNPEHNGFRYAWHRLLGEDLAIYDVNAQDPAFKRGEHLAKVFLDALERNAVTCHHTLYRAIGLNDENYQQVLIQAQAGTIELQPGSWTSQRQLTEQFGLNYYIDAQDHTKAYPKRIVFRCVPGSQAWSVGRSSVTGYEREWVITPGTFTVQDIDIPLVGDDIVDRSVVITVSQNVTAKTAATHDVSDEARASDGKWTKGPNSGAKEITKEHARGNSRPVSRSEFHELANKGKEQLTAIMADSRPAHAFDSPHRWDGVKSAAYQATRSSWGGQTINPSTGNPVKPKSGYAVTIRKPGQSQIAVPDNASEEEFNRAMDEAKAQYQDQLQGAQTYLGVFKDDDNKRIDIDPVAIVETPQEVETIGSYTHAVGGAYDFSTGDGYFPPHIDEDKEDDDRIFPVVSRPDKYKGVPLAIDLTMDDVPQPIQKKIHSRLKETAHITPDEGKANVVALFDRAPADLQQEFLAWYQNAHDMSRRLGKENGISPHVVAAVIAAASAGASWYSKTGNKDVAQVTVEEASDANRHAPIEEDRRKWLNEHLVADRFINRVHAEDKGTPNEGKKHHDNIGPLTKWQIPPGASLQDVYDNIKGETEDTQNKILGMAIGHKYHFPVGYGYGNFGRSMRMALDNDPEKITDSIDGPKIRSFFNNIEDPDDGRDVTIDIHMWRALANKVGASRGDLEKEYARMANKSVTGALISSPKYKGADVGAYPLAADIVRQATDQINAEHGTHYTPNQVQAVAWGQQRKEWNVGDIRSLSPKKKTAAAEDEVAPMRIPVYHGSEPLDDDVELWDIDDDDKVDEETQEMTMHTAAGPGPDNGGSGAMLAIRPPQTICGALALPTGEDVDQMHYTLVYVPDVTDADMAAMHQVAKGIAMVEQPFTGRVNGYGEFVNEDENVLYASLESGGIQAFRQRVAEALDRAGVAYSKSHPGYIPHCTLQYSDGPIEFPEFPAEVQGVEFQFNDIIVARGTDWTYYPLGVGSMSVAPEAVLHDEPEPALPSTDGELDETDEDPKLAWLNPEVPNKPGNDGAEIAAMARETLQAMGVKTFTLAEQRALIDEGEDAYASNLASLNLEGSHYEALEDELQKADQTGESIIWW